MLLARLPKSKLNLFSVWLVFYRRFISNFSSIASTLTDLTNKNKPNSIKDWQDHHERAFQTLKNRLTSSPILRLPVFQEGKPFVLRTDASDIGIGAVLLQGFEGEGRLPIAYACSSYYLGKGTTPS